jgi:hypothetical protein
MLSRGGLTQSNDLQGPKNVVRGGQKRKLGHDPSDELDYFDRAKKGNEISVDSHMSREDMEHDAGNGKNNNRRQVIRPEDNVEIIPEVEEDVLRTSFGLESELVITNDKVAPNGTVSTPPIEKKDASIQTAEDGLVMIVAESQKCQSSPPTTHDKTSQPNNDMNSHPNRTPNITKDPLWNNPDTSMEYSSVLEALTTLGPELPQPPVEPASPSFDSLINTCNSLVPLEPVRFRVPLPVTPRQYKDPRNAIAQTVENLYLQSPDEKFKVFYMYPVREGFAVRYVSGPPEHKKYTWKHEQRDAYARDSAAARTFSSNRADPGNQPVQQSASRPNIGIVQSSGVLENSVRPPRYIDPTSSEPVNLRMTLREYLSKKAVPPSFPSIKSEGYQKQELWSNATPPVPFRSRNSIDAMRDEFAAMEQTSLEEAAELSTDDLEDLLTEQSALEEGFLDDETEDSDNDAGDIVPPGWAKQGGKR